VALSFLLALASKCLNRSADDKRIYPLLLAYGASTATTTLACVATFLYGTPAPLLTASQRIFLLSSYVPFLLIPLAMAVDSAFRLVSIAGEAQRRSSGAERKLKGN
jgi:hypothetical protein